MRRLTIGSLFSGIGGLELGLEQAGLGPVRWQVEQDEYCRLVLEKHWPGVERFTDVKQVGAHNLTPVDVLAGGFPCTDVSSAGKRAGLAGEKSGLWFEYRRIIAEMLPPFAVVENVESGARRWLCQVRDDLHQLGYRTRALRVLASDVGAPHKRARIFVVAHARQQPVLLQHGGQGRARGQREADARGHGAEGGLADAERPRHPRGCGAPGGDLPHGQDARRAEGADRPVSCGASVAHADGFGLGRERGSGLLDGERSARGPNPDGCHAQDRERTTGTAPPRVGRGPDGLSAWLDGRWPAAPGEAQHDWEPPRTALSIPNRPARLRALGNAVVPACARVVGHFVLRLAAGEGV